MTVRASFPVRAPRFRFVQKEEDAQAIPRAWLGGSLYRTHRFNAFHMIFPHGEIYFLKSVNAFASRVTDPQLAADIRSFVGQEGRHGHEHNRVVELMRGQGYEVDRWITRFRSALDRSQEVLPASWHLAATAAGEHFTAVFARTALDGRMREYPAELERLFTWHAIEELEHKAVAFDVMRSVKIGYATRMVGLAIASYTLLSAWHNATLHLRKQDNLSAADLKTGERETRAKNDLSWREILRAAVQYARPGFHPNDDDDREVLNAALAQWAAVL